MSQDEVLAVYKAKAIDDRSGWEQARLVAFFALIAQQGSKSIKSPKDMYSFPWDSGTDFVDENKHAKYNFITALK